MRRFVLLVCLANLSLAVQAGELYRWKDSSGKVHYGDTVPPGATRVEAKKLPNATTPNEDLPYETRRARQNFPVTLYVADNCGEPCNRARSLLTERGIPFSEKLLRTEKEVEEFKKLFGSDTAPALSVGRTFLKSFQAGQWHDELSIAGYPKAVPYRVLGNPAAPAAASGVAPANPAAR